MGNDQSKSKNPPFQSKVHLFTKTSGPSSSVVQRHLETARKTRILQLKGFNLKAVPTALEEVLDVIRNLDLSQNKIQELPSYFGLFTVLKQLHLANNRLTILPDEIGCLKTLEILNLSDNDLNEVPNTLVGCHALISLNVSNNKLSSFPIVITDMFKLETVDLSGNRITTIPDQISNLQTVEINLSRNQLSTLHPNIAKCPRLKILRLDENCLPKQAFTPELLEQSQISLITFSGNLFMDREFQTLPGYETYEKRYTATKRKVV